MLDGLLKIPPVRFVWDIVDVYFTKRVGRAAAELAYFLVLTFFPILVCVSAFLGMLQLDPALITSALGPFLPHSVLSVLQEYLSYVAGNQSGGLFTAGLIFTVLFASAAVRSLMTILEEIYGAVTFRGAGRLVASVAISLLLLVVIYLSVAVILTGGWFFHLLEDTFHLDGLAQQVDQWQWTKYLVLLLVVFLFILLLYRMVAPLGKPRPPVLTGAMLASVALAVASMIFSYFMTVSTQYSLVYGSLASLVILLVWLYLCGNIIILGNVFNYVWYTRKKLRYARRQAAQQEAAERARGEVTGHIRLQETGRLIDLERGNGRDSDRTGPL